MIPLPNLITFLISSFLTYLSFFSLWSEQVELNV